MSNQELLRLFDELCQGYQQGFYKRMELVSKSVELLGAGNDVLWEAFPQDLRNEIEQVLMSISEQDELAVFGSRTAEQEKQFLLTLKRWLINRNSAPHNR